MDNYTVPVFHTALSSPARRCLRSPAAAPVSCMGNEQSSTASADGGHEPTHAQKLVDECVCKWQIFEALASPSPRETAGAVMGDQFVVVGGHDADDERNDVHTCDAQGQWTPAVLEGRPPRARSGHTVVAAPGVGIVVFGGLSHERGYLGDVALLSTSEDGKLAWTPVCAYGAIPIGRDKHSAVLVPTGGPGTSGWRMLTFGGFGVQPEEEDDDDDNDGDAESGERNEATGHEGAGTGAANDNDDDDADDDDGGDGDGDGDGGGDEAEGRGPSVNMGWFDETYALDLATWYWTKMPKEEGTASVPARAAHGACVVDLTGEGAGGGVGMLVFGGRTATGRVNDVWLLDGTVGTWKEPVASGRPPSARSFHSCVSLGAPAALPPSASIIPGGCPASLGTVMAVFGGLDTASHHLNDLHLLHAAGVWTWACVRQAGALPSPRGCAVVANRTTSAAGPSSSLVIFGGSSAWNEASGGSTTYHDDCGTIDLSDCITALVHAASADVPVPSAHVPTATASVDSDEAGQGEATAITSTAGTPPPSAAPVDAMKRPPSCGTAGVSKRKKSMPVKRLAATEES